MLMLLLSLCAFCVHPNWMNIDNIEWQWLFTVCHVQCSVFSHQEQKWWEKKKTLICYVDTHEWFVFSTWLAKCTMIERKKKSFELWVLRSIISFGSYERKLNWKSNWSLDSLTLNIIANNKTWIGNVFFFCPPVISPPCNQIKWKEMSCVLISRFMAFIFRFYWRLVTKNNSIIRLIDDQFHSRYSI